MVQPGKRIDAHIHYALPLTAETLVEFMERTGTDMANLVMVPHTQRLSCVPEALMAKCKYPDRFFVFTSLDASEYYLHPKTLGKHMAAYAKRMMHCGCDGIKLIEGRPNMRRMMPIPDFDLPCWEPFWAYAEQERVPILWHVNDPQENWDPARVTEYRKAHGDAYDESDVHYEDQYRQVETVLKRHPGLKIIFAHFFFLSGELPRLGKLLDTYPGILVDMTPGSEMYRILSDDHANAQAFFEKYQDRILYGTDIACRCIMPGQMSIFSEQENLRRIELIDSFFSLETDRIHEPDGEYLIDVPPFHIRGLDLSQEIIDQIYGGNFLRFVEKTKPAPVEPRAVLWECRRLKVLIRMMSLFNKNVKGDTGLLKTVEEFFRKAI